MEQCQPLNEIRGKIKQFASIEIVNKIQTNINLKKAPGHDKMNPKILKELIKKAMIHPTHIYNSILWTEYVPKKWKRSQVILLLKPVKRLEQVTHTDRYRIFRDYHDFLKNYF